MPLNAQDALVPGTLHGLYHAVGRTGRYTEGRSGGAYGLMVEAVDL